jgi:single-strand DNA-binding protein
MARGMNKVMIIGFVEREPEMRYTPQGQAVASFCISTNRRWMTGAGHLRETNEWFNVIAWGDLAEAATDLLCRDQRVFTEGSLQTRSWDDEGGQRHVRTEVVANKLIPMDSREDLAEDSHRRCEETPLCLNRVMIIGNLGRDPEMRYTPDGQAVTSFSLAATRTWSPANGGRRDATEWFNVVSWGSLAEICNRYLSKGRRVYVEGELRTRGWEQPDGRKQFRTELVANEMIVLGPRPRLRGTQEEDFYNDEFPA